MTPVAQAIMLRLRAECLAPHSSPSLSLLYLSLGVYGAAAASGVAQEKTTRVAKVLLATVRPSHLPAGKVVGIGVCGAAQLGIAVIAGLPTNAIVQSAVIPSTVWVLLPAILRGSCWAMHSTPSPTPAGALVGRQEEVQFASLPLGLPILGGFLLTYATIASPEAW